MTNIQIDLKVLMSLHNQGKYMFLIPCSSKKKVIAQIFGVAIALVLFPVAYELILLRMNFFSHLPIVCLVMDVVNFWSGYFFLAVFCLRQNWCYNHWTNIEATLFKTEILLRNIKFRVSTCKFYKLYFLIKFAILHLLFVGIHGTQTYIWYVLGQNYLVVSYILFRVMHYWACISALLIFEWLKFLTRRYAHINQSLQKAFSSPVLLTHYVVKELQIIGLVFTNLEEITSSLNELFSFHLLFLLVSSIFTTLYGLSFAIILFYSLQSSLAAIVYSTIFFANILVIVLAYEQLQKTSKNNIRTCLMLQEMLTPGHLRNELEILVIIMKKLQPKFSVIGFFQLDFQLISAYISIVFTYLIIVLQFSVTFA